MSRRTNPFVKREAAITQAPEEAVLHDSLLGARLMESGPASPDALPISPDD